MKLEDIFTAEELALIDSGEYKPGRKILDAKLDLVAAAEREAIAKLFDNPPTLVKFAQNDLGGCMVCGFTPKMAIAAIRQRGETK